MAKQSSTTQYGRRWRDYSAAFLARNPLCKYCLIRNRVKPATVTDHMMPHKGDVSLFWMEGNHQPLCATCHNSIKAREENSPHKLPLYVQCKPAWCHLITGPPASGKTTTAHRMKEQRPCIVYDLDEIAQAHGLPAHSRTWEQAAKALHWRNYLMAQHDDTLGMVIVAGSPTVQDKMQYIMRLSATTETLETPRHVCMERAKARGYPSTEAIDKWFAAGRG